MFDEYDHCPSAEAKKLYFLDTKDLIRLPYESEYAGFGCGRPTKWFQLEILERAATAKHGAAGLAKKRDQRKKREEKQLQKELVARTAREAMLSGKAPIVAVAVNKENSAANRSSKSSAAKAAAKPAAATPITTAKDLKKLRQDIVKAYKPLITWDYLNKKQAPNGCSVTAIVPGVTTADYAALIGRPTDTTLQTVVKRGAYYSVDTVPFATVMGPTVALDIGIRGIGGRYGCNSQLGLDPSFPMEVKFKSSDSSLMVTGYVQHVDTFGFD